MLTTIMDDRKEKIAPLSHGSSDGTSGSSRSSFAKETAAEDIPTTPSKRITAPGTNRRMKSNSGVDDKSLVLQETVRTSSAYVPRSRTWGSPEKKKLAHQTGEEESTGAANESSIANDTLQNLSIPGMEADEKEHDSSSQLSSSAVLRPGGAQSIPGTSTTTDDSTIVIGEQPSSVITQQLSASRENDDEPTTLLIEAELVEESALPDSGNYRDVEALQKDVESPKKANHVFRNRPIKVGIAVILLVAIVVGVVVGTQANKTSNTGNDSSQSGSSPATSSSIPTSAPIQVQATTSTNERKQMRELIQSNIPTTTFFVDSTSPQNQAFDWLIDDPYSANLADSRLLQRFALATLWYSTNGDTDWTHEGWLEPINECLWANDVDVFDVFCDPDGAVEHIQLFEDGLSGTLPDEVALMTSLTTLDFVSNALEGTIPAIYFTKLTNLAAMLVGGNILSGSIPTEIGLSGSLSSINMEMNSLTGSIPSEIGTLAVENFKFIFLHNNQLAGPIPSEIGLLTNLSYLSLSTNSLSGSIPSELETIAPGVQLRLQNNDLTGAMPALFCTTSPAPKVDCGEVTCSCCINDDDQACPSP
jgi:hypothetical protein